MRKDLEQAPSMSLRLPKANAQNVILTDGSFYTAGFVLTIEDYLTDQSGKTFKEGTKVLKEFNKAADLFDCFRILQR